MRTIARLTLLLLALPASAAPADPAALYKEFLSLGGKQHTERRLRRLEILFALRDVKGGGGRGHILDLLPRLRSPDEHVAAIVGLSSIRTLAEAEAVCAHVARFCDEDVVVHLSNVLRRTKSEDVKRWIADQGLASRSPVVAAACCRALMWLRVPSARATLDELWQRAAGDDKLAYLAHEALGARGYLEDGKDALVDASRRPERVVRQAAADYLACNEDLNDGEVAAIRRLLEDADWRVGRAALHGLRVGRSKSLLPVLVERLESETRLSLKASLVDVLEALTERDLGYDAAAWRAWLREEALPEGPRGTISVVRYYGRAVVADDVCFVVDLSSSMLEANRSGVRQIDVARDELLRTLDGLLETTRFNIVTFADRADVWRRKGSVPATKKNVTSARVWIEKHFRPEGATNTYEGLRLAFEVNKEVDTMFLLSDGLPSVGRYTTTSGVIGALLAWNLQRRVVIHTVVLSLAGTSSAARGDRFMKQIAVDTHGDWRIVTKPPPAPAPEK